ncbi:hypothetical protein BGP_2860 [Beggiatoa sp. PS]|nr:hypothetical protein BGP_2860 [Beggiatoa sp. PS]
MTKIQKLNHAKYSNFYSFPITNYPLPITNYPLPITNYQFPIP